MTYAKAIQFLYDLRMFGATFGLESTFKLAALADNSQKQRCFIAAHYQIHDRPL